MRKRNKEIQLTSYENLLGMDTVADQAAGQLLYVPFMNLRIIHLKSWMMKKCRKQWRA